MADEERSTVSEQGNGRAPRPVHPRIDWERRDASLFGVLLVAASTVVFGIVLLVLLFTFFKGEERNLRASKGSAFPLAPHPSDELPARPRLEPIEQMEHIEEASVFRRLLAKENQLHSYGETSDADFVRIPIDVALRIAAKQLPVSEPRSEDRRRQSGLIDAGESNSGRLFRGERR
jgi:hypothetical protein